LLGRERKLIFRNASKPIRAVIRWQFVATMVLALIAGLLVGIHGAISAMLGGLVSIAAGLVFAAMISLSENRSAWGALHAALRAEAVKIGLIVLLLYLVLATYEDVATGEFIGSFIVSVLIFGMAIVIPEQKSE
jgi:ATP synthase protein I